MPGGVAIPSTWMTVRASLIDASGNFYKPSAAVDVSNFTTNHIVMTYTNNAGSNTVRFYVNANPIEMAETFSGVVGNITNNLGLALFSKASGGGLFSGDEITATSYSQRPHGDTNPDPLSCFNRTAISSISAYL